VAIKVLAPGYYANQDTRTPVRVAIAVLVITQLLNVALVPFFDDTLHAGHAALTLSIGIGAMINAIWLLVGLLQRGSYKPEPGWGVFALRVIAASALLLVFLMWANGAIAWTQMRDQGFRRIFLLAIILFASAAIYFVAIGAAGLKLRQIIRR
jgi:putative peptidoglycan lipid II flippase